MFTKRHPYKEKDASSFSFFFGCVFGPVYIKSLLSEHRPPNLRKRNYSKDFPRKIQPLFDTFRFSVGFFQPQDKAFFLLSKPLIRPICMGHP
jgi:hypothetical protein